MSEPADVLQRELSTGKEPQADARASFLELLVGENHSLLLPMRSLVEIVNPIVGQIVPMFQMPPWVMGVYNWRGDVLWMVDLGHFLGVQPWYTQAGQVSKHTAVVLRPLAAEVENSATVGLVVNRVKGMVTCPLTAIAPTSSTDISPELQPYALLSWDGSGWSKPHPPCPVLDGETLLAALATSKTAAA